jgi:DNA-binding NarL/FixJ family response regulator
MIRNKQPLPVRTPTRVLVLADDPGAAIDILQELADEGGVSFASEVHPATEAIKSIERFQPDIVLLDLKPEAMDPLFMIKHIRARFPEKPLLLFSPLADPLFAARVLRAGARGYLMRTDVPHTMLKAIHELLEGGRFVSERPMQGILHGLAQPPATHEEELARRLSDRELMIFRFIGQGHDPYKIARELNVSIKTVLTHRSNMKKKLLMYSLQELTQAAEAFVEAEAKADLVVAPDSASSLGKTPTGHSGARPIPRRAGPSLP